MAGFIAGMLGAGAGLVIVPVLLILNVKLFYNNKNNFLFFYYNKWIINSV